ncbi:dihydrofolate reductase family protein [Mucilaginibacter sp. X5P1]|uniref:dihydrofolate reductase family protein n=1 Tax=Mucilaginibacter sp. X5P1 TaxID=2723088 RepID=UPI00160D4971|nr:dihydrofolate reductase family protein [Mucilaginibacter sp. X5P1]MBB6140769.1 dihydrofolate reductase [Mucilaginibacter sp. X5P1]
MAKLSVFNFASLNGYYKGPNGDISWHRHGAEEAEFSAESMQSKNILLFGRVTYDMMVSFWPTPMALERAPREAKSINDAEKIVFSTAMDKADWNNTRIINGDIINEVKKMKQTSPHDMTILGSGSIIVQLAEAGLIDEYQIMFDPVVLGDGGSMFKGMKHKLDLDLISAKTFKSGTVLLSYKPMNK